MSDERKEPSPEDAAWLEQALLSAAAEFSAHRQVAAAERQRLTSAQAAALARLGEVEQQKQASDERHAGELRELAERVDSLLGEQAQAWRAVVSALQERLRTAGIGESRLELARERIARLERELHDARAQSLAKDDEHRELERRLLVIEQSFVETAEQARRAREHGEHSASERDELRAALSAADGRVVELLGTQDAQRARLTELTQALATASEQAEATRARLEGQLSELTGNVAAERELSQQRLADKEQALQEALARALREQSAHEQASTELRTRLSAELTAQRHAAEEQRTRLSAELTAQRHAAEELHAQLEKHKSRLAVLEMTSTELEEAQAELQREHAAVAAARQNAAQAQAEVAETKRSAAREADELKLAMRKAAEDDKHAAAREVDELTLAMRKAAEDDKRAAAEQMQAAQALLAQARGEAEAARRERDEARTHATTSAELQAQLDALRSERDQLKQELQENTTTRWAMLDNEKQRGSKLKSELDAAKGELGTLREQSTRRAAELGELRVQLTDRDAELGEARTQLGERDAVVEALRGQLAAGLVELETLRGDVAELQVGREIAQRASSRPAASGPSGRSGRSATLIGHRPDHSAPVPEPPVPAEPPAQPATSASRGRESTAYSVTEVQEEQIFVPPRGPSKGSGGGTRGTR